ncbi:MAG: hypothetical protein Q9N34_06875 [Aquificota bacterium]|nr:hypothetical protein [Aquificota bacterium]
MPVSNLKERRLHRLNGKALGGSLLKEVEKDYGTFVRNADYGETIFELYESFWKNEVPVIENTTGGKVGGKPAVRSRFPVKWGKIG